MAHSGYVKRIWQEVESQSGIKKGDFDTIKSASGLKGQKRLIAAMDEVVAYIKTQSNGPGVFTETTLSGGGWAVEQNKDAASGSSTGTGLDNMPAGIKHLVQNDKFTGQLQFAGTTGGYYWITDTKLYRFKNRNQNDEFQKALVARMSIDAIGDLSLTRNKNLSRIINTKDQDKVTLTAKKSTATTYYATKVAAIINSGAGVAG